MSTTVIQFNDRAVRNALMALGAAAGPVIGDALHETAEINVMTPAKELCPVDMGDLRGSGQVQKPSTTGRMGARVVEVKMGFGNEAAKYAAKQHEELSYEHTVGEAKYLEKPLNAIASSFVNLVGGRIRSRLL